MGCNHDCSSCSSDCKDRKAQDLHEKLNKYSSVKKVIGVVSGKGGVGKSLVTSMLAVTFQSRQKDGDFRCRHHRSVHSQGIRTSRKMQRKRGGHSACVNRNRN